MAPVNTRKQILFAEVESSFGAGPSVANGSAMIIVPVDSEVSLKDEKQLIETTYQQGRNSPSQHIMGADGATISFSVPLRGMSADADNGESVPSADSQDKFFNAAFGTGTAIVGRDISSNTGTALTMASDYYSVNDVLALWESGVNSSLTHWRRLTVDGADGTYTMHRAPSSNFSSSATAFGNRYWYPQDNITANSLTFAVKYDDTTYLLKGCRPSGISVSLEAGKQAMVEYTFKCDNKTESTSTLSALPSDFSASEYSTAAPPIIGDLCEFCWAGTAYGAKSIKLDFGLATEDIGSVAGTNGRSNIQVLATAPTLTIDPLYDLTFETAFRAGTVGAASVFFGSGTNTASRINACCFDCAGAQISGYDMQADGNRWRQSLTIKVIDAGMVNSTTAHRFWTFARA